MSDIQKPSLPRRHVVSERVEKAYVSLKESEMIQVENPADFDGYSVDEFEALLQTHEFKDGASVTLVDIYYHPPNAIAILVNGAWTLFRQGLPTGKVIPQPRVEPSPVIQYDIVQLLDWLKFAMENFPEVKDERHVSFKRDDLVDCFGQAYRQDIAVFGLVTITSVVRGTKITIDVTCPVEDIVWQHHEIIRTIAEYKKQ